MSVGLCRYGVSVVGEGGCQCVYLVLIIGVFFVCFFLLSLHFIRLFSAIYSYILGTKNSYFTVVLLFVGLLLYTPTRFMNG